MRCKKHYTDLTSIVGVCASCLRQRLISLIAAQEQAQAQSQSQGQTLEENNRNSDTNPVFPRSVSPYICRRKSDNSSAPSDNRQNSDRNRHRHQSLLDPRFFSTPQVGPTNGGYSPYRKKKYSFIRFSLFANLFRSKKRNGEDSDPRVSISVSNSREACGGATSVMSSPAWFSNIRPGGASRKKQPVYFDESSTTSRAGRKLHCRDRGMSPVRHSDGCGGGEDEFCDGSSGYESCESRQQTPWRTPAHSSVRRAGTGGAGNGRNVAGLAFCLSPLVRASPHRNRNQKGMSPADGGDIRAPVKPHLSNTKSFCANRSRKLADFGRLNPNR